MKPDTTCLLAENADLKRQCDEMREDLKTIVSAILKKGGKTVLNTTALKRLEELHEAEQERDEAKAIAKEAIAGIYNLGDYDLANRLSSKLEETK